MSSSRAHVVETPFFLLPLRAFQLILSIILLGLFAYLIDKWGDPNFDGFVLGGFGVGLFSSLLTMILTVYFIVSTRFVPAIYNFFAVAALEVLALIFWLVTWALEAKTTAWIHDFNNDDSGVVVVNECDIDDVDCVTKRTLDSGSTLHSFSKRDLTSEINTWENCVYTALAFSLIIWLTFIASTAFLLLSFNKHRSSGAPLMAGRSGPAGTTAAPVATEMKDPEAQQPMPATTTTAAAPTYEQPAVAHQQPVVAEQQPVLHQDPAAPMH